MAIMDPTPPMTLTEFLESYKTLITVIGSITAAFIGAIVGTTIAHSLATKREESRQYREAVSIATFLIADTQMIVGGLDSARRVLESDKDTAQDDTMAKSADDTAKKIVEIKEMMVIDRFGEILSRSLDKVGVFGRDLIGSLAQFHTKLVIWLRAPDRPDVTFGTSATGNEPMTYLELTGHLIDRAADVTNELEAFIRKHT